MDGNQQETPVLHHFSTHLRLESPNAIIFLGLARAHEIKPRQAMLRCILHSRVCRQHRRVLLAIRLVQPTHMVKESGAQGLVLFMQQFCDPEEMEFPYLKKALDAAGIPFIKLGVDQQMRDFGQAATAIQAFADVLSVQ